MGMIYILIGTDYKKKRVFQSALTKKSEAVVLSATSFSRETLFSYANEVSLFGESPVVVIENLFSEAPTALSDKELLLLKDSPTIFIFNEDAMLASVQKKYLKYATIEVFENKSPKKIEKINVFDIASAFGRGDKITAWSLYCTAVASGVEPEPISGILFWKIKTMILGNPKPFTKDQLQKFSSQLVSLYHRAHRGECDFTIGLEQFILSSLHK